MNLAKTSIFTFIATAIKLFSSLIINKAISVYIGPSGLAVIGQFQNAIGIGQIVAQGGINSGVTKYTAEYHTNPERREILWSTSLKLTLFCSFLVCIILICGSRYFSKYILDTIEYSYVFITFGFTLTLFSLNQLLLSILNGIKDIKTFISINILQSVYALVFTTLLIYFYKLDGALIALVTNQSIIFIIVLWKLRSHSVICLNKFKSRFNKLETKNLIKYSLMTLVSAVTMPVSLMIIRNHIGETLSWNDAGYWQAMTYISSMYLMVITTTLSTYYLPRLSEITQKPELRSELKHGYKIIVPILLLLSSSMYFLKDFIVWLLFTPDFKAMLILFKWQLLGDIIKIISWLLGYMLIAKAHTKAVIISELLFSLMFIYLSIFFIDIYGLIGVSYAYFFNYLLHFLFMFFYCKYKVLY